MTALPTPPTDLPVPVPAVAVPVPAVAGPGQRPALASGWPTRSPSCTRCWPRGNLDPAELGLGDLIVRASCSGNQPDRSIVPLTPIRLVELQKETEEGLSDSTLRTYRTYLNLLVKGWPAEAPDEEKLYPGLGDRWSHEVLATELEEALRWVERRARLGAFWLADARERVGRVPRDSDGSGARCNAVSAWRCMFGVAVKDRHLAK